MISNGFRTAVLVLLGCVGVAALVVLRLDNRRLRQRITAQQQQSSRAAGLRNENQRTQQMLARSQSDAADGARAIRDDVERLRREVVELEQRAEQTLVQKTGQETADRAALQHNRDPRIGLTAIEHFTNAGQATPSAALQSLIWAASKGDETELARLVVASAAGRAKAAELLATLPPEAAARWTAEKLGLQFYQGILTEVQAMHFTGETLQDAQQAKVEVRLQGNKGEVRLSFQLEGSASGWRVVITEQPIAAVQKRMRVLAEREAKK